MKTKYLLMSVLLFSTLLLPKQITAQTDDCGSAIYEDDNGLVVIEAENLAIDGTNWSVKFNFSDFTGAGYLSWDGNNNFNSPGNGLISTEIRINTPGTYRFRWRSRIGTGSNSTEHNDSWLRFADASDFYAEKNGNRIYPNGSGQTPNPNGSSSNGWFKAYLSGSTNWTWSTQTSDNDAHQIYVVFETAGIYTMEISGRSKDHLIDRITLSNDATDPLNLENSETPCTNSSLGVTDIDEASKIALRLYPNPAQQFITIESDIEAPFRTLSVFDYKGAELITTDISKMNNQLDISQLATGIYFARTNDGETLRFIKN